MQHSKQILKAFSFLSGGPQKARGSIIGNINDIEFGIAILNATVTDSKTGGKIIKASITNVPRTLGQFSNSFICLNLLLLDVICIAAFLINPLINDTLFFCL